MIRHPIPVPTIEIERSTIETSKEKRKNKKRFDRKTGQSKVNVMGFAKC